MVTRFCSILIMFPSLRCSDYDDDVLKLIVSSPKDVHLYLGENISNLLDSMNKFLVQVNQVGRIVHL